MSAQFKEVDFASGGHTLRGRLYSAASDKPAPCVVMAHGTSGTFVGQAHAPCLMATDDEAFSCNHRINRINRLFTVQEHCMLRRAIDRGGSRECLARAFNVNLSANNLGINLL